MLRRYFIGAVRSSHWRTAKILAVALMAMQMSADVFADSFNEGWTFWREGQPKQNVRLPHDAMIHGDRSPEVPGGNAVGYYEGDMYHYEKTFFVPSQWLDAHVEFKFQGVYKEAKVYLNGTLCADFPNGYLPFTVNADGLLHEGENTILVTADNRGQRSSRWYSGGGIYRNVELIVKDRTYISDVKVSTLSTKPARIGVLSTVNSGEAHVDIIDQDGRTAASGEGTSLVLEIPSAKLWDADSPNLYTVRVTLSENGQVKDVFEDTFGIRTIEWSNKGLFINGKNTLLKGGCIHSDNGILGSAEYDQAAERKVRILKQYGFNAIRSSHNGCSEAILKACDKLGMYIMDEPWDTWWRPKNPNDYGKFFLDHYKEDIAAMVKKDYNHPSVIMYSVGNEVNEPTAEGGLEMTRSIVSSFHELDSTRPVTSGFNTTILASGSRGSRRIFESNSAQESSGKEEPSKPVKKKTRRNPKPEILEWHEPEIPEGGLVGWMDMMRAGSLSSEDYNNMVLQYKKSDDYMVLSAALDSIISPVLEEVDIIGYNYAQARYPYEGTRHPEWVILGSETYPQDIWDNWQMVKAYPYTVGDFMWTAWDYLGECGLGSWTYSGQRANSYPGKLSEAGVIDLVGNPTGEAFHAKVTWEDSPSSPYICVRPVSAETPKASRWRGTNSIPSWTWKGMEGVEATVEVFSSASKVKLFLNGKKVGSARPEGGVAQFRIAYEPGELTAKAYGKIFCVGKSTLRTAQGPSHIRLTPEDTPVSPGQLVFVKVDVVGENGEVDTSFGKTLKAEVSGGELVAFGSAVPVTEARFDAGEYPAHYGQALAAIIPGEGENVTLTVSSGDLDIRESIGLQINR